MFGDATQNGVGLGIGNIPTLTSLAYPQMLNAIVLGAFSGGAPGWLYDDSRMDTLYQDAAGTTPVTALEQPVGKQLDLSGRGNHRTQPTSANRPTWSARYNLLTKTEDVSNAAWTKANVSASNANTFADAASTAIHRIVQAASSAPASGVPVTGRATLSKGTRRYVVVGIVAGTHEAWVVVDTSVSPMAITNTGAQAGDTYISSSVVANADGTCDIVLNANLSSTGQALNIAGSLSSTTTAASPSYLGDGSTIIAAKLDLRPYDQTLYLPPYQRVDTATSYDSVGFPAGLRWNGSNSWMQNASVDFSGTNKLSVFVGVRKLSDAAIGVISELSVGSPFSNGSFVMYTPDAGGNNTLLYSSRGTAGASRTVGSLVAPITMVATGQSDISAPSIDLRVNKVSASTNTTSQGTGNYGNYPAYFGARAGSSLFFNGLTFSNIAIGIALSASQIAAFESWTNSKCRAY